MRNHILLSTTLFCLAAGYSYGSVNTITSTGTISIPATSDSGNLQSKAVTATGIAGSISTITITLNDWNDHGTSPGPGDSDREMMLVFQPTGCSTNACLQTFQFLGDFGAYDSLSNYTVTFADSSTVYAPDSLEGSYAGDAPPVNGATYKPTVNYASNYCSGGGGNAAFVGAPVSSAPCATDNPNDPQNNGDGHATFASQFSGSANGTWTLYIWTWGNSNDSAATIDSFTLSITTQVNATNTSTSLTSNAMNNETLEGTSVTLTATVTPTPDGGTVDFTDNGNTISNCGSVAVSSGTATCTTSFSTEGYHPLEATYNGDSNFGTSHGTLNFFVDHPTTSGGTGVYCNTGTITINTNNPSPGTTPYPQHITVPSTSFTIADLSLTLNSISTPDGIAFFNFLLVDPNGHQFVPMAGTGGNGGASNVSLTLSDGASSSVPDPTSGTVASGTYLPTDTNSGLSFASSPYGPPSGPYSLPQPQGGATFDTTFGGANPTGQWSLYAYYASGEATGSIGGYCLNITTSNAASTTTTVTSSPSAEAATGHSVTFTATVKTGSTPVTSGAVTFKENGTVLSGPTALNGSGQATFETSSLSEGIHTITANYSGVTGTFQVSSGMVSIEIDTATTNPTAGVYCNPGGISISSSNNGTNTPLSPYPSRIDVTGVAGTVNNIKVELNNFTDTEPDGTVMLLEGPTATNIVFWNNAGGDSGFSGLNLTLADGGNIIPAPPSNNGTYSPTANTSPNPTPVFPAPAPSALSFAPPEGTQTFTNAFATINPNGYWSLFMYDRFGGQTVSINNWCLNVVNNPPVVTLAKVHNGTFTQGDSGDTYTITVANPSGPGSTVGTMTLTDSLPSGITATAMSETGNSGGGTGSDWTCTVGSTSCTRTTAMAPGETDTITLTVSVSYSASTATNGSVNHVSLSGGGISGSPVTASDTQTVQVGQGYTLTTSVNPSGGGTITANPANSAGLNTGHYVPGTIVTLTANPAASYGFSSWSGSADLAQTTSSPTTITMNSATENVTANFVVTYTNVTSSVSMSSTGFTYNKIKKQGTETVTITNNSGQTISGPIQLVLSGVAAGVTAVNNTGTFNGNPYWTVAAGSLAPGASAQVSVTLAYASGSNTSASSTVYSGNLQ